MVPEYEQAVADGGVEPGALVVLIILIILIIGVQVARIVARHPGNCTDTCRRRAPCGEDERALRLPA
jgi:hypothetical protein